MSGISDFLSRLSEPQWDSVLLVIQELQDSAAPARMESLRKFLSSLDQEIDDVNRKRDVLGKKADNIKMVVTLVEGYLRGNPDLEVELLKNVLVMWESSLRLEIAELRPNDKLEKKYDTERKRKFLIQIQTLVSNLNVEVTQAKVVRNPPQTLCGKPRQ
jgi:hypothetical protein